MLAATIGPFGAEKPFGGRDGLGIGLCIVKTQSQNRPKRNTIPDLKLQLMVRPVVAGIQNHDLEPEPNIKRLSACMDFGSWSRTVARVWPNCCQVTFNQRMALWSSCSKLVYQSKSPAALRINR